MPVGFSVKLPLTPDANDGFYKLNKTFGEVAKQNLKMVVLTATGERMMQPEFGVGLRNYLFGSQTEVYENLPSVIESQVKRYVPYISIKRVDLLPLNQEFSIGGQDLHYLGIRIIYNIPNSNISDTLEIKVFNDW